MTPIVSIRDLYDTGQCIKGIKFHWERQVPDGFPTYREALKNGVPLSLAKTSDNPIIKAAVRVAIGRIVGEEPLRGAIVLIAREVAVFLAPACEESAE